MRDFLFISIFSLFCFTTALSQSYEVRSVVGITYYQGDLSPLPVRFSFSQGHPAYGVSLSVKSNKYVSINSNFLKGTLSGTDEDASGLWRRRRNLNFTSYLYEFGVTSEFYLNPFIKQLDKFGVKVYYTTGINVFHFNPKTQLNGEWIALQPLGTEGQELAEYGNKSKYSLTQINIPFGMGINFNLSPNIVMGFEVVPRLTFTDYIDDVSGSYVNYDELLNARGLNAASLSNRTGEYLESEPVQVETGTGRGDPNDNDWYLFTGMYIGYKIGGIPPISLEKQALEKIESNPDL